MIRLIDRIEFIKIIVADVIIAFVAICLPSLFHNVSVGLYLLDPMRMALFAVLILTHCNKYNAYVFALMLPIVTCIISGHPLFVKSFLIAVEMVLNVCLFFSLSKKKFSVCTSCLVSILISKLLYYILKYVFVISGLLEMSIISTPLKYQLLSIILITLIVSLSMKGKTIRNE